jgi:hypothetical protein
VPTPDFSGSVYFFYSPDGSSWEIMKGADTTPVFATPVVTGLTEWEWTVVDPSGDIFFTYAPQIIEETPSPSGSGYVQNVFYDFSKYGSANPFGLATDTSGNLYVMALGYQGSGNGGVNASAAILKMTPTTTVGSPTVTAVVDAPYFFPTNIAVDGNGNVFACDDTNVYEWSPSGSGYVETIVYAATSNSIPIWVAADPAGNLFIVLREGAYPAPLTYGVVEEVASPSGYTEVPLNVPGMFGPGASYLISVDLDDNLYTALDPSGGSPSLVKETTDVPTGMPFAPVINLDCIRQVGDPSLVTVGDADYAQGATTYYTTDGTTPSTSSTMVTYRAGLLPAPIPFEISQATTIKAIAVLNGVSSPVAVRNFTPPAAYCSRTL